MKTLNLPCLAASLAAALFSGPACASITLELGDPEYAACGHVSINGYVAASPGAVTNLVWNWDDATTNESWFPATHTYPTNAAYTVTVTAYADTGESQANTCSVVITDACHIDLWLMDPEYGACGFVSINGAVSTETGAVINLVWAWGDGTTDESWFPTAHQYPTNGAYTVAVTAYADTGVSNTVTCSVVITNVCTNIVLQVSEPEYAACGRVSINGHVAASPGTITNLIWNWGDGTANSIWFPATRAYASNGVFTVRVTAYSDLNESRTIAEPVSVTTVTPTCGAPRLSIALTNSNLAISWSASAEGWVLEATNALPQVVAPWPQIGPPYQTNGPNLEFIEPVSAGNRFYRLHKP